VGQLLRSLYVGIRSGRIADGSPGYGPNVVGVSITWVEQDRLVQILNGSGLFYGSGILSA
jgi:hypothetical protein